MGDGCEFKFGEGGFDTMRHLVRATLSEFVEVADKPDECDVVREIENYIDKLPDLYQTGMVWLLRALEAAPLVMGYRRKFSNLAVDEQVKVLESFEKSANFVQRSISITVKSLVIVLFFSDPAVERAIGYDHACLLDAGRT